jgi:hypothetical protein
VSPYRFSEWLVNTFGIERLRQGSGVVDVAGGKGYLSFQLQCGHDIPTTLIEPRRAKLHRKQKKCAISLLLLLSLSLLLSSPKLSGR